MQITKDSVVSIEYTLTNDQGAVIDTSDGREPLSYIHGSGHIIPGLEKALEGKSIDDSLNVTIPPADGYGERNDQFVMDIPRTQFQGVENIEPGMQFQTNTPGGPQMFTVVAVADETVKVDGNHPLAGANLNFEVKVMSVRAATESEIQSGQIGDAK